MSSDRAARLELEQLEAHHERDELAAVDAWEWRRSWRRVLEGVDEATASAFLARLEPGTSRATFSTVLELNPNHSDAEELAELADAIAGPIPDTLGRRRHA